MKEPRSNTLDDITEAVRESARRLALVPQKRLKLIVGLVLRFMAEQLQFNRKVLIAGVADQLKKRGIGIVEIIIIRWVIALVIDMLINWMTSSAMAPKTKIIRMISEDDFLDDLPELL